MALLIVHPDYTNFSRNGSAPDEFPAERYAEFLRHVQETYAGQYWNALPREVAGWYRSQVSRVPVGAATNHHSAALPSQPAIPRHSTLAGKRAAVVLYSYYATDPRPRRETEALRRAGMEVDVICLRQDSREPRHEILNGIHIHARPVEAPALGQTGLHALQYLSFFMSPLLLLFLVAAEAAVPVGPCPQHAGFPGLQRALLPKLLGARVILDLHDPMPELLVTIFGPQGGELRRADAERCGEMEYPVCRSRPHREPGLPGNIFGTAAARRKKSRCS